MEFSKPIISEYIVVLNLNSIRLDLNKYTRKIYVFCWDSSPLKKRKKGKKKGIKRVQNQSKNRRRYIMNRRFLFL